ARSVGRRSTASSARLPRPEIHDPHAGVITSGRGAALPPPFRVGGPRGPVIHTPSRQLLSTTTASRGPRCPLSSGILHYPAVDNSGNLVDNPVYNPFRLWIS